MTYNDFILYELCLNDWYNVKQIFKDCQLKSFKNAKRYFQNRIHDKGEYFTMFWGNIRILIYNCYGTANLSSDFCIYSIDQDEFKQTNLQDLNEMMEKYRYC